MTQPEQNEPGTELPRKEPVRLCKDCRQFHEPDTLLAVCLHAGPIRDPVYGVLNDILCAVERSYGECGAEGKFWTPKITSTKPLEEKPF